MSLEECDKPDVTAAVKELEGKFYKWVNDLNNCDFYLASALMENLANDSETRSTFE